MFKKWTHVIIFSIIEFVTPLALMMFAPVVPQVLADIADDNITRTTLAVSIYVLGFIVGHLIFGPLSQLYGRMVIYRTTVAVLSASIVTRSTGGSTITLAGPSLNKRLGYGWASTVLATKNLIFLLPAVMLYRQPTTCKRDLKMNEGLESVSTPENMGTPSPTSEPKRNEPVHDTEMLDDPDAINIVRVQMADD
jgi:hypothetical protein